MYKDVETQGRKIMRTGHRQTVVKGKETREHEGNGLGRLRVTLREKLGKLRESWGKKRASREGDKEGKVHGTKDKRKEGRRGGMEIRMIEKKVSYEKNKEMWN